MNLNPCNCGTDLEPDIGQTETGAWRAYCRRGSCRRGATRKDFRKAIEAWNLANPVTKKRKTKR